jgi:tRNA(Ile)-lysidine synthase
MHEQVAADGLLAPGRPVVVLFSGGRDSTCLLDLAAAIAGADAVTALHVNYGLRDTADDDAGFCEAACARLGVRFQLHRACRRSESGNVQAWARDERYGAAAALALELDGDIASGQTATDQLETILYRLASSPSRRALLGMRPRDGRLVRPLLPFTRADTETYCLEHGLEWRDDETNDSERYARGRVRNVLVPAFKAIHPGAEQNVLALAAVLRDEAEVLDALVDEALRGRDEVSLAALRSMPAALRRLVVQRLADGAAPGGLAPGAARRADEIAALGNGAALDIGSGVRAVVRGGAVWFARTPPLP